jgi:hypothetical protein
MYEGQNKPYVLTSYNKNFYSGVTGTTVNINEFTALTLSGSTGSTGSYFIIRNQPQIQINTSPITEFGQMISNAGGNYTFNVLRGNLSGDNLYGYNIIEFNLLVNSNSIPPVSTGFIDYYTKQSKRRTRNRIKKIISKL